MWEEMWENGSRNPLFIYKIQYLMRWFGTSPATNPFQSPDRLEKTAGSFLRLRDKGVAREAWKPCPTSERTNLRRRRGSFGLGGVGGVHRRADPRGARMLRR